MKTSPSLHRCLALTLSISLAMIAVSKPSEASRHRSRGRSSGRYTKTNSPAGVFALYQNPNFGYGSCLAKPEESPDAILERNGIKAVNASTDERAALAKGISQVNRLLGGPIPKDWRINFQWVKASGAWNSEISRSGFVTIKRLPGSPKGKLTGRMMHELGHKFGHANGAEKYRDYAKYTHGKRCYITTYCHKNINEEFAETFEAYVTHPDFLEKHCPDTFAFFQKEVFKNAKSELASCSNKEVQTAANEERANPPQGGFETASTEFDQGDVDDADDGTDDNQEIQVELTG